MNGILRWDDPPAPKRPGRARMETPAEQPNPWQAVAEELRTKPGQWAVIYAGNQGQASTLASSIGRAHDRGSCFAPAGSFEAVSRTHRGTCETFARFVGGQSAEVER